MIEEIDIGKTLTDYLNSTSKEDLIVEIENAVPSISNNMITNETLQLDRLNDLQKEIIKLGDLNKNLQEQLLGKEKSLEETRMFFLRYEDLLSTYLTNEQFFNLKQELNKQQFMNRVAETV